jgi:hypothetical protein
MGTPAISAEGLFTRYFAPLYPAGADLARLRSEDHNPGQNPAFAARIAELAEVFVRVAPAALGAPDLVLDYSDASVHRMGAALTSERLSTWLREAEGAADPLASPPTLVAMATHGALYVGECVRRNHDATWLVRQPLWESLVRLHSARGVGDLPLFHWWLKALADLDTEGPTLFDRYRTHVEVPTFDASAIPVLADPGRRLPRLHKVRYDTLHQHLRAHLPELKTVGDDFPSAARLDELALTRLDFKLVGGGPRAGHPRYVGRRDPPLLARPKRLSQRGVRSDRGRTDLHALPRGRRAPPRVRERARRQLCARVAVVGPVAQGRPGPPAQRCWLSWGRSRSRRSR